MSRLVDLRPLHPPITIHLIHPPTHPPTFLQDDDLLTAIHSRFRELDRDGSGALTKEDFLEFVGEEGGGDRGGAKGDAKPVLPASSSSPLATVGLGLDEEEGGGVAPTSK